MTLAGAVLPARQNLSGVLPSALAAIGKAPSPEGNDAVARGSLGRSGTDADDSGQHANTLGLPAAERACIVLVDGLGYHQMQERIGHAPNFRAASRKDAITSVVPSTTAAGITAFGTGRMPGQTAMAGYSLRVPGTDEVFSLISWNSPQVRAETWQSQPTLFEAAGADLVKVQPQKYVNSGLTNAGLRGGRTVVAESLPDRVATTIRELRDGADLVYLYWDQLDMAGHRYGWMSERWTAELEHVDAEYGHLANSLPAGTLLVVTADHGMVDVNERVDIRNYVELTHGVAVVAGESRAVQLYTDTPVDVAGRWREFFGDEAWIVTKDEAIAAGLFGSVTDFTRSVIGDVFAFARGRLAIVDSRVQSVGAINLIGVHGSLTSAEMHIPLLVDVR